MGRRVWTAAGLAGFAYLLCLALGIPWLRIAAKPVPVALLAVACAGVGGPYARLLAAGLGLSALADLAIEWSFVGGLVLFLLAHLAYTAGFWIDVRSLRARWALPFAAYGLGAFLFLRPGLGAMAAPVAVYMLAICTMLWRAASRLGASPRGRPSEQAALAGALLFAASDTLIALDRFHAPIAGASYPIMLLYWAGQAGLALSVARTVDSAP